MYRKKNHEQAEFESFHLSFGGRLRSDNRWVKLSKIFPWKQIERRYTVRLNEDRGAPALSARIALRSLIIKEKPGLSDEETVEQIRENPYLQYFRGYEAYLDERPFDPSMMVHFRKRLGGEIVPATSRHNAGTSDIPNRDPISFNGRSNASLTRGLYQVLGSSAAPHVAFTAASRIRYARGEQPVAFLKAWEKW